MKRLALGLAVALAATAAWSCSSSRRPRDVVGRARPGADAGADSGADTSTPPPPPPAPGRSVPPGAQLRVLARAACRAIALDASRVYFGNNEDDGVYSVAKEGGEPVRLARRAPVAGALAIEGPSLAWVATPGDVVLRTATAGGSPLTVRERGIFADVAMQGGDVFIAEVAAGAGVITRVTGGTTARIASLETAPRAIAVDATHVYVATATKLVRAPHERGAVETLATGAGFDSPVLDGDTVYAVAVGAKGRREIVRVGAAGGATVVVADVRAAPIAIEGGELFYFDAERPELRALALGATDRAPRVVAVSDDLARPMAIAADAASVYVATGERDDGALRVAPRR
jgi:hypothetical protein